MQNVCDALEEINHRGIDMRDFAPDDLTSDERQAICEGFPDALTSLLFQRMNPPS